MHRIGKPMEDSEFKPVGVLVHLELLQVNDVEETFDLDFVFITQWIEPESNDDSDFEHMTQLEDKPHWTPSLLFHETSGEMKILLEPSYFRRKNILYSYNNWIITFKENMELRRFPFDRQLLRVNGFSLNAEFVPFQPDLGVPPCVTVNHARTCLRVESSKDIWLVEKVKLKVFHEGNDSQMKIQFRLTRRPEFYLFNILFITFLIVMLSYTVYIVDVHDFSARMGILETNFLTAVAFKFTINTYIPAVSYLTLLDIYMILTFTFIFAIVVASVIMSLLDKDDAQYLNFYFTLITSITWISIHILILISNYFGLLTPSWEYVENHQENRYSDENALVQNNLYDTDNDKESRSAKSSSKSTKFNASDSLHDDVNIKNKKVN